MRRLYFVIPLFTAQHILAQTYDNTFNGNGFVTANDTYGGIGQIEIPTDILYEGSTGKIIMLNQFNGDGANIHRLNADGTHDATFGTDGKEELYVDPDAYLLNIFNNDDDGYRLTGYQYYDEYIFNPTTEDILANGSVNTSFYTDGINNVSSIDNFWAKASCKGASGKYFLVGSDYLFSKAGIMSFNADGSYNPEFGYQTLGINEITEFYDVIELPDGRIIAIGETHDFPGDFLPIIACYLPDGTLDASFGTDGIVMPEMPLPHNIFTFYKVAADEAGNIFVGGDIRLEPSADGFKIFVAKFDSNGNLVTGFGTDGYAYLVKNYFPEIDALLITSSNNIYGLTISHGEIDATRQTHIFKLFADGTPDADFTNGEPGMFKIEVPGTSEYNDIDGDDMIMQEDGKLVVLGHTDGLSLNDDFWITRITTNETPVDAILENEQLSLSIYPNPANEFVTIVSDISNYENTIAEIWDITGNKLMETKINSAKQSIDVSALTDGIYEVIIRSQDTCIYSDKLIIIK